MEFALYCIDKPDSAALRASSRLGHLENLVRHADHVRYGGPLLDEQNQPKGSLLVMSFPQRADLDRFMASDPYFISGMFESVTVWPTRQVFPEQSPGSIQQEIERQRRQPARSRRSPPRG
jgi:uncharacterized protein YciI